MRTRRRAAVYVRVSTSKRDEAGELQNPALQVRALRETIQARGWQRAARWLFSDRASGGDSSRPGYRALLADAKRGAFDVVLVWRFDRLARSAQELINALEEFRALGIDFLSHQEALDTSTPAGKALYTMIAAFAEFERNIIQERVRAGIANARAHGTRSGNPFGRPKAVFPREKAGRMRREGFTIRQISKRLKVGVGTVQRALQELIREGVRVDPL